MTRKILLTLLLLTFFTSPAQAQTVQAPVAHAIMFWMSGCKHCQETISITLPPLREKYGEQLDLQLIQIYSLEEVDALYALGESYNLEKQEVGVPFLIIGDQPLIGYDQIRLQFPQLIETHLAAGGVDLSERPELRPLLKTAPQSDGPPPAPAPMDFPNAPASSMRDNGFILAVVVLLGMILALLYAAIRLLIVMFRGIAPAAQADKAAWLVPTLAFLGLLVAGYLSYVELTLSQAFCGPVGDCNAVQSSSYARLFGILPVGVLGAAGYLAILAAWWAGRQKWGIISKFAPLALFGMAFFGSIFSTYLTYLEPFVIRAVCIWCITSAVLITTLMLIALNPALQTLSFDSLFGFHRKVERVALQPGGEVSSTDPGLGFRLGQSLDVSHPVLVSLEHDIDRSGRANHENTLQNVDHKIHRGQIVIVDDDPVQRFQGRLRNRDDSGGCLALSHERL